jgi:hypothetical protein
VSHNYFAPLRHVGFLVLSANASAAFLLNLATMALIKHTSALTLNVSGVFKDIGLILWSARVQLAPTPSRADGPLISVQPPACATSVLPRPLTVSPAVGWTHAAGR